MSISWYHLASSSRGTAGTMVSELNPMQGNPEQSWILDSMPWIPDSRYWIPDFHF